MDHEQASESEENGMKRMMLIASGALIVAAVTNPGAPLVSGPQFSKVSETTTCRLHR
jgi:hypothetical protein